MDKNNSIRIRGARVHNLKNISVVIPKNKFVVITGLSGSGKSSLAFDTIYAEAERRFVESLSSYARQFLGVKEKPDVDAIDGLSPAISIDQKSISRNPRSTVGTITEIYDYLRILFARIGHPHCPQCGHAIGRQTVEQMITAILTFPRGKEITISGPMIRDKKGEHHGVLEEARAAGFLRAYVDGQLMCIEEALGVPRDKKKRHSIEVVVDRFLLGDDIERSRIRDSLEVALKIGTGLARVRTVEEEDHAPERGLAPGASSAPRAKKTPHNILFSEKFACTDCGINLPDIEPRMFSFNSPYGACPVCTGLGSTLEVDSALVIPNPRLSIAEGAIRPWSHASHRVGRQSWYWWVLDDVATRRGFSLQTPVEKMSAAALKIILHGELEQDAGNSSPFEGVIPNLKRRWKETDSDFTRSEIEKYMIIRVCASCNGRRLGREALAIRIGEETIATISERTIENAGDALTAMMGHESSLGANEKKIAAPLIKEMAKRLMFLRDVGLEYLTLARDSTSLSGGEAQRIQLATQLGSRLTGIIYILDEPSIGLHPRDHARLIATLKDLRDLGNTVIVVEHDAQTMKHADWIIDIGPGAGSHGGQVVFSGTSRQILGARTLTGEYLSGKKTLGPPVKKNPPKPYAFLEIRGATEHNLKMIDVRIPLGLFVCVSGVSGSGKSTLVNDIIARALRARLHGAHLFPGAHKEIRGIEHINKTIVVDQSPIGRTPRSNPATYTGAFGIIRSLFAATPEARSWGYTPGRFSFNVKGGRCEACEGQGVKKIEMYFLPDVYVECEECGGKRYNHEALEIEYNGKNIAEVLDLSVEQGLEFFKPIPAIRAKLETLRQVGLDYVKLGQPAPTFSGGEAQRIKLATELSRRDTGRTFYILDEPTTGLHFDDIRKLLRVLEALVEKGNTVLVVEHNIDVIRNADWIIDLGPEGGDKGGTVVAEGTPKDITKNPRSYTGKWIGK